jgi:hypothetical protein
MEIKTKQEALEEARRVLNSLGFIIRSVRDANHNRDYLIATDKGTLYLKYCRQWKNRDEYHDATEPHTIYATINQSLLKDYHFDNLLICHISNGLYTISKDNISKLGYFSENPVQGEKVVHIPIREMKRVYAKEEWERVRV